MARGFYFADANRLLSKYTRKIRASKRNQLTMFSADDFKKEPQKSQSKNREKPDQRFWGKACGYVEKDSCIKSLVLTHVKQILNVRDAI